MAVCQLIATGDNPGFLRVAPSPFIPPNSDQADMPGAPQSVLICGWADGKWMVDLLRALVRPHIGRSSAEHLMRPGR